MNQGKFEVVKQEIARVNIYVLGTRELRWTGMAEFNSDDHYIYYCGQESFRRNWVVIVVNKSLKCSTWMQSQKRQNDLYLFPRQAIQCHSNLSLCPDWLCWRSWSGMVLWRPTRPSRTNTQKIYILFIIRDWNAKVGSQEIPGLTGKFGLGVQNEAGQRLTELCQENIWIISNTLFQQHRRKFYTWTSSDWWYSLQPKMEKLYMVSKNKNRSWLWLRSWTLYWQIQT